MPVPVKSTERYEFREILGEGGMGVVYRAFDRVVRRDVAVKTIRDVRDKNSFELFRKECSVLANFAHPHIVEIFDFGELDEQGVKKPFFVMPFLSGLTLDKVIESQTETLTIERCVDIVSQVCRGLQAAHDTGLVHRDLKPSNIFILPGDSVKIIDFGIAHLVDTKTTMGLKGTLLYMAPEQVLMKKPTHLTDLFSLGVVCFEMLTRRRPYDGSSKEDIVEQIVKVMPPPASQFNSSVSLAVSQVIHKAMAKLPYHRFGSVKEFGECFVKAARNEPIEIFNPDRVESRVQRAKKAFEQGELEFASEIITELEAEALLHPEISGLHTAIDEAARQKTIRQLLETAHRRFEEDEYQLALQKVQEILNLDPPNTEAHALKGDIESKRTAEQIDDWFKLAWQHMENHAYAHARKALQNVLQVRPKEQRAQQLLAEVDRREQDYLRLRKEKEEAYRAAEDAYHRGELSSALTKLERVLDMDLKAPDTFAPDRAAIYQKMYNEVRSEHDRLTNVFSEVRRNFENGNLATALTMCKEALEKYPNNAMFQSLKLDIEVRQRQELSAFIARIDREVDGEPDLNNRIRILEKALHQYPEELHFQQSLQTIKSKRDLVESIVTTARSLEERGAFSEAMDKWEILQNIYPQYPGLTFELERVRKRREARDRQESKTKWVDRIDRARQGGEFERALSLCKEASREFPNDAEVTALEKSVRQDVERAAEAQRLVDEARVCVSEGQRDQGLQLLRQAYELDPASTNARGELLSLLLTTGRASIESDWRQAEDLLQQALELDPGNPMANSLRQLVNDKKEEEAVTAALSQARECEAAGDVQQALNVLEEALAVYPSNLRLLQLKGTLRRKLPEPQRREMRQKDLEQLRALERETQVVPNDGGLTSIFNQTSLLVSQYQGDQEFEEIAKTIMHKAAPPAPPALPPAPAPRAPRKSLAEILAPVKDKAVVLMAAASAASAKGAAPLIERGRKALHQPLAEIERRKLTLPLTALATILAVVGMAYIYKVFIRPSDVVPSAASVPLIVEVNPAGARYSVVDQSGTDVTESASALKPGRYTVRASLMGYEPREVGIDVNPGGPVTARVVLPPIPPSFVLENEREGAQLLLDGQPLTAGENGNFVQKGLSDSEHKAEIAWNNYKIALSFRASRAAIPEILSFESPKDLKALAVTEFGGQVKVWRPTGVPDIMQVSLDAEAPELIGPTGQKEAATAPGAHTLNLVMDGDKRELSLNAGAGPQVLVFLAGDDYGYLAVDAGLPDIKVFIDGRERRSTRGGGTKTSRVVQLRPGEYAVRVVAPEHEPGEVKVAVEKGKVKLQKFGLKAIPQFATLVVLNGKDFSVSIDGEAPNTVSSDKSELNVAPGRKNIHITHPKYEDWSGAREFVVNEPLTIDIAKLGLKEKWSGARVAFVVTPPDAPAAIRVVERANTGSNVPFSTANPLFGKGKYTAIADAPGYKQGAEPFDIAENQQTARVEIKMERIAAPGPPLPPPPPKVFIENFDSSRDWSKGPGGSYVRKSDATTFYKGPGYGVFELVTLCKKGFFGGDCRAKVYVGYQDVVHNVSFDVKKKTVDIRGEDGTVQTKNHNQDFPEKLRLRITVQPNRVKLDAFSMGKWVTIATYDDPKVPLTKGRFGIQYADTLYDFKHTP